MKRRMSEEVTRCEMLRLREDGYSNTEIAEQLECCYATVLKYIGKGGGRKKTHKSQKTATTLKKERLSLFSRTFRGEMADFTISANDISLRLPDLSMTMNTKEFEEFAKDVLAVSQLVG